MDNTAFSQPPLVRRSEWHSDMSALNYSIDMSVVNADHLPRYPTLLDLSMVVCLATLEDDTLPPNITATIGASAVWPILVDEETSEEIIEQACTDYLDDEHIFQFVLENLREKKTEAKLITEDLRNFDRVFLDGVVTGAQQGYVPVELKQSTLNYTLKNTPVFLYDGIDYGEYNTLGDYSGATNQIRLLKAHEYDPEHYLRVLTHERVHAVSGGTFFSSLDDVFSYRNRTGFSTDLNLKEESKPTHTALNEAITEHIARSIVNGEWDVLNPFERSDYVEDYVYVTERHLLSDLIEKSSGVIDLRAISRAYFEDSEPNSGYILRKAMVKQFIEAYEYGTIRKFEDLVKLKYDNPLTLDRDFRDMIHAPEFDIAGKVIKKGFIKLIKPEGFWDTRL